LRKENFGKQGATKKKMSQIKDTSEILMQAATASTAGRRSRYET
jgi:hypothetical protein